MSPFDFARNFRSVILVSLIYKFLYIRVYVYIDFWVNGLRRFRMEPMDIIGKSKEDASLPKGRFLF